MVNSDADRDVTMEFTQFVDEHRRSLYHTAYLLTHDPHHAEDLLQTALTEVWRRWSTIDGEPVAYCRKALLNNYISSRRRRWWGETATDPHDPPPVVVADHQPDVALREDLRRMVDQLPPRQRAVIVLRFGQDFTEAQTAEALGVTVGTVKSQTAKALATLRGREDVQELNTTLKEGTA
ncbi:SigE family RNA polymerase sigma factor [Actinomycetota bacterium]